jgi:hypothetical protein
MKAERNDLSLGYANDSMSKKYHQWPVIMVNIRHGAGAGDGGAASAEGGLRRNGMAYV